MSVIFSYAPNSVISVFSVFHVCLVNWEQLEKLPYVPFHSEFLILGKKEGGWTGPVSVNILTTITPGIPK